MAADYLGPLERRVMGQLWQRGPLTVADILETLNAGTQRKLAYTTVMTILVRLHEKGYASRSRSGRTYTYQAVMDEPSLAATIGRRELGRLIDRYGAASLAGFADELDPRSELARRLREVAAEGSQ